MKTGRYKEKRAAGWLLAACLLLSAGFSLCSCSCKGGKNKTPKPVITVAAELALDRFESAALTATVENSDKAPEWASLDARVAVVDENGMVEARGAGETKITASIGDVSASCAVSVSDSGEAPALIMNASDKYITEGETFLINVRARYKHGDIDADIKFASSNPMAVSVDGQGLARAAGFVSGGDNYSDITVSAVCAGYELTPCAFRINIAEDIRLVTGVQTVAVATGGANKKSAPVALSLFAKGVDRSDLLPGRVSVVVDKDAGGNTVATYNALDGTFTGVNEGSVKATFTYAGGGSFATAEITVAAETPVIETGRDFGMLLLTNATVSASVAGWGITAANIEKIIDVSAGDGRNVLSGVSGSSVTFDKSRLTGGERLFDVRVFAGGERVAYRTSALVVTRVIGAPPMNAAAALADFKAFMGTSTTPGELFDPENCAVGKYYRLGQNITDTSYTFLRDIATPFNAVLDGAGFSVQTRFGTHGLFKIIGEKGVVKNVAFKSCRFQNANSGFLSQFNYGLIQNVFMDAQLRYKTTWASGFVDLNYGEIRDCAGIIDFSYTGSDPDNKPSDTASRCTVTQQNHGSVVNVFTVGLNATTDIVKNPGTYVGRYFTSVSALQAAVAANPSLLEGFDTSPSGFWVITDNFPYPRSWS